MPLPAPPLALALAALLALAPLALAAPLPAEPPPTLAALPGGWLAGYATPAAAVPRGGTLVFLNGDIMKHDVVSVETGPGGKPWCSHFPAGRCPVFWTPLISLGQSAAVQGLEDLEPLHVYHYYCTIHNAMRGTLLALPALPEA